MSMAVAFFGWMVSVNAWPAAAVPGGLYIQPLAEGIVRVEYFERPVLMINSVAIVGIALSAKPGEHELDLTYQDGSREKRHFTVSAKQYPEQRLTIANPRMVNPDPADLERIRRESSLMREQYVRFGPLEHSLAPFLKPVDGITSSPFGRRRILNDQPRNPHSGLDIAAITGTPIKAPAPAKVTLTGDFYFNGKTVFLDHGGGLITMYSHMSEIIAAEGDDVIRGATIGLVGATGRVTGPHLHWSVNLNGNRVNPVELMTLFPAK
jgi:murein DD-endopeptidase MepM/ murein hydrolase activator NlpD